jgi:hypothetical protein
MLTGCIKYSFVKFNHEDFPWRFVKLEKFFDEASITSAKNQDTRIGEVGTFLSI